MTARPGGSGYSVSAAAVLVAAFLDGTPRVMGADVVKTVSGGHYHAQLAGYTCTVASMEMVLDCTAVTSSNAFVRTMLSGANPDGTVFEPFPNLPRIRTPQGVWVANPNYVAVPGPTYDRNGNVTANAQAYVYGLTHAQVTFPAGQALNPPVNCYRNAAFGLGTEFLGAQTGLNLLDTNHLYRAYVFPSGGSTATSPAGLKDGDQASRTIARALWNYDIPAIIGIDNGRHAVCVYGVRTDVSPSTNLNFEILGFYVHDPWAGYQAHFPNYDAAVWQENEYVRYGWDTPRTGGIRTRLPDGTTNSITLRGWFQHFNPRTTRDAGVAGAVGAPGYKILVEPAGPEAPDNGAYLSVPPPPSELSSLLDASHALLYATNELAADPYLIAQPGFMNGAFDPANAVLLSLPADASGYGDWLIPYEGPGGVAQVTGYLLVDASTGVIDEAVWMNPGDMVESMAWPEVIAVETSNFAGNTINDNDLPAPQLSLSVTTPRNLLLSWPVSPVVPYLLEQNNSLSTTNWVLVTNLTTVVGGQNQVVLPLAQTTNSFFRLSASPGF